ncbi:hypothetical protein L248_3065 [Schleiferilactobacillus shenzhenensis LY-73]|uniref:Uncharacterized protein n=2 Tax=Schleiferilactobacillus shenzhenensis TaxID=1231337 RepID=U4TUM0_9LACO|nr:hypothetical protein L248_3065 [Schleiferilactobacillus shenzhenensis LY-73]
MAVMDKIVVRGKHIGWGSLSPVLLVLAILMNNTFIHGVTWGTIVLHSEPAARAIGLLALSGSIILAWVFPKDLFAKGTQMVFKILGGLLLAVIFFILVGEILRF